MAQVHLLEIKSATQRLGSLKALLGMSQLDDLDWENIAEVIDDITHKLDASVTNLQSLLTVGAADPSAAVAPRHEGCCGGCSHH
jgi:hypothetical protein